MATKPTKIVTTTAAAPGPLITIKTPEGAVDNYCTLPGLRISPKKKTQLRTYLLETFFPDREDGVSQRRMVGSHTLKDLAIPSG